MKKVGLFFLGWAALAIFSASGTAALAQQADPPLVVRQLKPDVYWTEGGNGGNTGIIIGKTGVIVVDAKGSAGSAKQVLAEIAKLTPKPVTHVILTHSDGDHVNGLAGFPLGLTIIAHEGDKKEQEAALAAGGPGAPPADHQPTMVVTKTHEALTLDGVKVELYHWAPAHTSGDLVIYLPEQKIVFGGDVIATNRPDPRVHQEKNGSSEGLITTMKNIGDLDADTFVPGHGGIQTKAFVQDRAKKLEEKRKTIAAMVKQGKSLEEIKAAVGDNSPPPPAGGAAAPAAPSFTETVYAELTKK
jgi:cyclase